MYTNNKLSKAVRLAIAFGAASSMAFTAQVVAGDEEETARVERIEVTGSRIRRSDLETASPITVIGKIDIEASGVQSLGDLLRNINQADLGGLTQLTNNTNGNDGSQTISLRNLGTSRNLILVDGRRWLALGGGQTDISQIPIAIVERVEILADGASAIYGSDAVSGVINIITRRDFEGAELDFSRGENFEGDGEYTAAGVTIGARNNRSSVFVNINKTEQKPIMAGDRDISKFPVVNVPEAQGSAFGEYGIFFVPGRGFLSTDPDKVGAGERTEDDFIGFGNSTRYNYAPDNYLFMPSDRLSFFMKADHEVNNNVRAFLQATYNQRKSVTQIAAVPITAGFSGPQWNIAYSEDNLYNPFGVDLTSWGFRTAAIGPRTSFQDYDTYFLTGGLEGDFEIADRMLSWDVYYSRGEASRTETGSNYVNLINLERGVGPSFIDDNGFATCGTADNPLPAHYGCVPVNLFNGPAGFTQDMANYLNADIAQKVDTGAKDFGFNLSGEIFELPAGWVGMAVGYQNRSNIFADTPDTLIRAGGHSSNFREPTKGMQNAKEMYFEFAIPLLRDLPGVQHLELSIAGRTSEFTNDGFVGINPVRATFDNDSYKFGFTWRVFEDLMIRGNRSDTFRAPSVSDLFAGGSEGFPSASDPCNTDRFGDLQPEEQARCIATGVPEGGAVQPTTQLRALGGGNPTLVPESGTTKTLGVVYNPSFLDGFDMTLDWYSIELSDALSGLGAQAMLNRCILEGQASFCNFIERRGDGRIETVRTSRFNLNSLITEGFDVNFNYRLATDSMGTFNFKLNSSYTKTYKSAGELETLAEADNRVGSPNSDVLRLRSNFSTTWSYNDLAVTWSMRHTSSLMETCWASEAYVAANATAELCNARNSDPDERDMHRIGSVVYHDVSASYALPWDASVRVGTRNLFRKNPPTSIQEFANSFRPVHDIPGGNWFVNYQQKF